MPDRAPAHCTLQAHRRQFLKRMAGGLVVAPLIRSAIALAATDARALISEQDPAAQTLKYVEDVRRAPAATAGANCANCSLYSSVTNDAGGCTLFPNKLVKAEGWCTAWSGL